MDSNFVSVGGNKFHVLSEESGQIPVVMAHGFASNAMCMKPIMKRLPFDARAISYDAKAHGLSDAPSSGYGKDEMAHDLIGIVDELGIENPVLYGHSLGANTVMRASNLQDSVRFCVLEDPAGLITADMNDTKEAERRRSKFEKWRTSTHVELKQQDAVVSKFADLVATAQKQMRPEALNITRRGYDYIGDILENPPSTLILRPDSSIVDYDISERRLPENVSTDTILNASHTIFRSNPRKTIN
jgi:Predicted hydrolases or acyltransferases (alpha/beta hydrolase superfamily)